MKISNRNSAITVSQLNSYIEELFRGSSVLSDLKIQGEIIGFKNHSSGHKYFSIRDEYAKVNCFLSKNQAVFLRFIPEDGMHVEITGFLSVYKPNGTYSVFVKSITPAGEGTFSLAFEALKRKLDSEGLFSPESKKPIPRFASHIGIVTSENGAAVDDIITTIKKKNNKVKISLFPSLVQGEHAASDIANKIESANRIYPDMDVLIVGRGGGSVEDLWAYNEEVLARAVYNSSIPIISAVGHEMDWSICDFVADYRAETPTAAGEKAAYDSNLLVETLKNKAVLLKQALKNKTDLLLEQVNLAGREINSEMDSLIRHCEYQCERAKLSLSANNPNSIMEKGYSMAESMEGRLIRSVRSVKENDRISINLIDGRLLCTVNSIKKMDITHKQTVENGGPNNG
ncbi:MAG: exodeoxyribonuclease VII large subunit [Clostridiales bacterium]|nr:exodeoxyribonuclease VII large subunit [Clostridiales bacterium]